MMNGSSDPLHLLACGQVQQALQAAEACLQNDFNNADLYNIAGICAITLGDHARAEHYWRQTIRLNPKASQACFNLGLLCARSQRDEEAEQYYRKTISIDPGNIDAYNNLGLIFARGKQEEKAEYWYRKAISLNPGNSEIHTNLGVLLAGRKKDDEAEQCYRNAIVLDSGNAEAYSNLGVLLAGHKQNDEAERCYRKAISLNPCNAVAYSNLGILLAGCKKDDEAEQCYRNAIALDPVNSEAYTNLGLLLENRKREEEAEACQREAVKLSPGSAEIHSNLASLLTNRSDYSPEAEDHYLQAIAISPESAFPYSNLGVYLTNQKRDNEAEHRFRQALAQDPDYQLAHLNLGFLLLSQGRFAEGWIHHEARYDPGLPDSGIPLPNLPFPKWRGESLAGKSLLVWLEQGFGDEIQFCRYLPLMKKQLGVHHITYVCKASLKRLMETLQGVDSVIAFSEIGPDIQPHDYWTLPLSIPLYWKGETGTFPTRIPYLKAPAERIAHWKPRLPIDSFRVGLVWRGNGKHHNDNDRSLPWLSTLAPLWTVPGVRFVSLQMGLAGDEAKNPPQGQSLLHLGFDIADFSDTAAIIDQLDLLICVDTAVAHLAGALGKACWVLLPAYRTDWRWLRKRSDSPWYPGVMRLFRQTTRGVWTPVIEEVRKALCRAVSVQGIHGREIR
ncbi:MAG: tetratricopeptide repeat protein [Deltaproteobacteria bacterium]|nr:tetratricopeptide repeat protein [Deltaproteobacteria bacterium]